MSRKKNGVKRIVNGLDKNPPNVKGVKTPSGINMKVPSFDGIARIAGDPWGRGIYEGAVTSEPRRRRKPLSQRVDIHIHKE